MSKRLDPNVCPTCKGSGINPKPIVNFRVGHAARMARVDDAIERLRAHAARVRAGADRGGER